MNRALSINHVHGQSVHIKEINFNKIFLILRSCVALLWVCVQDLQDFAYCFFAGFCRIFGAVNAGFILALKTEKNQYYFAHT